MQTGTENIDADSSFADLLVFAWRKRRWLAISVVLFGILGTVTSLLMPPVYYSEALVMPKTGQRGTDALSQLRSFQLGIGDPDMNKMSVLLKGFQMADSIVRKHDLKPLLFPDEWDEKTKSWIEEEPDYRRAANELRAHLVLESDSRKNLMRIGVKFRDSVWAKQLVTFYMDELNAKMRMDAINDANTSREFLENQLNATSDPVLRQRIIEMIGHQIQKATLVHIMAIEILEYPMVPDKRLSPQRKKIVAVSLALGVFAYAAAVVGTFFLSRNIGVMARKLQNAR